MHCPLLRHRRIVGGSPSTGFYCNAAAGGRGGTVGHSMLAGAARRDTKPQWRTDALADRERAVTPKSVGYARARRSRMGRRAVPRAWPSAGPLEGRA